MSELGHLIKNGASDNLRLVQPERVPSAAAALQFQEMIEAGVAIERVDGKKPDEASIFFRRRRDW